MKEEFGSFPSSASICDLHMFSFSPICLISPAFSKSAAAAKPLT